MNSWKPRRFWSRAGIIEVEGGFAVSLDGRTAATPSGNALELPTQAMAELVCAEWSRQQGEMDPSSMPHTRLANTAIDRISSAKDEVVDALVGFAGSDLLCHRAERPEQLVARQRNAWDPVIRWADHSLGAPLNVGGGVMPIRQASGSLCRLRELTAALDPFALAGLSEMVALTGSLVIGHAVIRGRLAPEVAWNISRIDEQHQSELWGIDREAEGAEHIRRGSFLIACAFALSVAGRPANG